MHLSKWTNKNKCALLLIPNQSSQTVLINSKQNPNPFPVAQLRHIYSVAGWLKMKKMMAKNRVPIKSPMAVRIGIELLSGSIFFFHRQ